MRVPLEWLGQFCAPPLDAAALAERLAMTGTEVERVERFGVSAPDKFVVGRVLEARPHPDADRLRICFVDLGDGDPSQIVCGAPNVAAGQTVAVAKPGAVMPDGSRLAQATLRGVQSWLRTSWRSVPTMPGSSSSTRTTPRPARRWAK
jgi:phenylalanyl-tRNA synthetase beta chain